MIPRLLSLIFRVSKIPQTWRWYVISTPWFGVKIHWIKEVEDEWHTHPWNGFSIIFGSYEEEKSITRIADYKLKVGGQVVEHNPKCPITFCSGWQRVRWFNRISAFTPHRTRGNVLTLFIHGPRVNADWYWGEEKAPWRGVQNEE